MNPSPIGSEIHAPLNLRFFLRHIAVEYERHTVDGVDVTKRIIAHTDTPIVREKPAQKLRRQRLERRSCLGHHEPSQCCCRRYAARKWYRGAQGCRDGHGHV